MNTATICPKCLVELPEDYPFDHVAIDRALAGERHLFAAMSVEERRETVLAGLARGLALKAIDQRLSWSYHHLQALLPDEHPNSRVSEKAWLERQIRDLWCEGVTDREISFRLGVSENKVGRIRKNTLGLPTRRRRGGNRAQQWKEGVPFGNCAIDPSLITTSLVTPPGMGSPR